jgi:hypothetical protein
MSTQVETLYNKLKRVEQVMKEAKELEDDLRGRLSDEVKKYGEGGYTLPDGTKLISVSEGWAPDYRGLMQAMGVDSYSLRRQFVKPTYDYTRMAKTLVGKDVAVEMSREFGLGKVRAGGLRVVS